ncbi:heavy metal-binding domain-containing protein [Leifsonia sp. NPDC056665]|uniref:heavy metal-binding domain-containing protein n=1 Tax=Leifsonia sp. NPDC056665 TaxID=3345901 RepID=UPI0036956821
MTQTPDGLPAAARSRVERQAASGVRSSLFSAPAAAAARSAGLLPVGEVFGGLVVNLGWTGTGCAWWSATGPTLGPGMLSRTAWRSPVTTSGGSTYAGYAPYVKAFESAWYGAVRRMLAEARALGAHGVVGATVQRTRLDGSTWEFTALGTAVRSDDPLLVPYPKNRGDVWSTNLTVEDTASAILSGYSPGELLLGISISTKHEDYELRTQRTSWVNGEVTGMTELVQAARAEALHRLETRATATAGAQLVVTDLDLGEFETPCGEEKDLHAEATVVGATLIPVPRYSRRAELSAVTTVIPLSDLRPRA